MRSFNTLADTGTDLSLFLIPRPVDHEMGRHCIMLSVVKPPWSWLAESSRGGAGEMLTANQAKNRNRGKPLGWLTGENRSNRVAGKKGPIGEPGKWLQPGGWGNGCNWGNGPCAHKAKSRDPGLRPGSFQKRLLVARGFVEGCARPCLRMRAALSRNARGLI